MGSKIGGNGEKAIMPYKDVHSARAKESRKRGSVKWRLKNKPHTQEYNAAYYLQRRDDQLTRSKTQRLAKYGITEHEYNMLLFFQNGVCAICGQLDKSGRQLAIDHDHISGKNRALLCGSCNNGLGRFKDNVEALRNAANYLEFHQRQGI